MPVNVTVFLLAVTTQHWVHNPQFSHQQRLLIFYCLLQCHLYCSPVTLSVC